MPEADVRDIPTLANGRNSAGWSGLGVQWLMISYIGVIGDIILNYPPEN